MAISRLKVDQQEVLISREIEQAPPKTMIRELIQNAIEAQRAERDDARYIEIGAHDLELDDDTLVPKLFIRNNGKGMTAEELRRSTDLSASVHKILGRGMNYGIGGKVSGLRANPAGMRYRTCTDKVVSEVTLIKEGDYYGREQLANGADVLDVTREYSPSETAEDWTEVVLYGADIETNTIVRPFEFVVNGERKEVPQNWIHSLLLYRYFRLPENTEIKYAEGIFSRASGARRLQTYSEVMDNSEYVKKERCDSGDGYSVWYVLNTQGEWNSRQKDMKACGALVYQDEMFNVANGSPLIGPSWGVMAPRLAIPFGHRKLSVFVELHNDYPCEMNTYRDGLISTIDSNPIDIESFSFDIELLKPQWVVDYIDSERKKHRGNSSDKLINRFADLVRALRLKQDQLKVDNKGTEFGIVEPGGISIPRTDTKVKDKTGKKRVKRGGITPSSIQNDLQQMPIPTWICELEEIKERGLVGFSAEYIETQNEAFINEQHAAWQTLWADLCVEYKPIMNVSEDGRSRIEEIAREEYAFSIIAHIAAARFSKREMQWNEQYYLESIGKASLTAAVWRDSLLTLFGSIRAKVNADKEIKAAKVAA